MVQAILHAILPRQKQNQVTLAALLALFALTLLVNLFLPGAPGFVAAFNNLGLIAYLVFAAVVSAGYWWTISNRQEAKQIWLPMTLGVVFCALAQVIWVVYDLSGQGVPFPSLTDGCLVIAYLMMCLTLINRNRQLKALPDAKQVGGILSAAVVAAVLVYAFVLRPIYQNAGPGDGFAAALNTFYLLMDLALLIIANFLGATMIKARLSLPWNLINTGFLFLSVSDIYFVYAIANNLYYPAGAINTVSRWIDLGYNTAGLMLALGVFMYQVMVTVHPEQMDFDFARSATAEPPAPKILPYTPEVQALFEFMYLMVDPDRHVFFFSDNFRKLCQLAGGPAPLWGTPLHRVISVDEAVIDKLFDALTHSRITALPAELALGDWHIPVVIQAHTVRNSTDIYLSYRLDAERVTPKERVPIETMLINQQIRDARGLERASGEVKETTAFFIIEVQELYTFLVRMNGFRVGQILADQFNQAAASRGAEVCIRDGQVQLTRALPTADMAELLHLALKTVSSLTTVETTQSMVRQLNEKIPEHMLHAAQNAGLAL